MFVVLARSTAAATFSCIEYDTTLRLASATQSNMNAPFLTSREAINDKESLDAIRVAKVEIQGVQISGTANDEVRIIEQPIKVDLPEHKFSSVDQVPDSSSPYLHLDTISEDISFSLSKDTDHHNDEVDEITLDFPVSINVNSCSADESSFFEADFPLPTLF